jgi:hypothetical protein
LGDGRPVRMVNIVGGLRDRSTVTEATARELGIPVRG